MPDALLTGLITLIESTGCIECEYGVIGTREILIIFFLELWLSYFRL